MRTLFETRCYHGLRFIVVGLLPLLCGPLAALAEDVGWHSTIVTANGPVRDDELAEYVAGKINENGGQVKDVKLIFNNCFGGGFLDDFARVFGPGGTAAGTRWVGVAAATATEQAWCYRDEWADSGDPETAAKNLGSKYTSGLAGPESGKQQSTPGSMRDGTSNNVKDDFTAAAGMDEAGPNWENAEHPQIAWGNGGENITWHSPGEDHRAVFFGGNMDHPAYENDFENMTDSLLDLWGPDGGSIGYVRNGTREDLFGAIDAACTGIDGNTQLILYFTDHGDRDFDFAEWWQDQYGEPPPWYPVPGMWESEFNLDDAWMDTMSGMLSDPGDTPAPRLDLVLLGPIFGDGWRITMNGLVAPLSPGLLEGPVSVPLEWQSMHAGPNLLRIETLRSPGGMPMILGKVQLSSGPVGMRFGSDPGIPATSTFGLAAFGVIALLGGALLIRHRSRERITVAGPRG